jgi:hypothetical protein
MNKQETQALIDEQADTNSTFQQIIRHNRSCTMTRLNSQEVALVQTITQWWSREVEEKVTKDGWNAYLVTFMFNHVSGLPAARLKIMQDSVCRCYSTLVTRVVRKPNSIHQLHLRPLLLSVPDYPVFKYEKNGLTQATVNDGLHIHSVLVLPSESRLKEDVCSHVARKPRRYIKKPLYSINFAAIENNAYTVTNYVMKSVRRGRCRWEDVFFLPKSPSELNSQ